MADVMQQQQAMGQAATGGPPDPNKGGKKPEGHGEGDDDPSQRPCPCGKHLGPHISCALCGRNHKGECQYRCKRQRCGRKPNHTARDCPHHHQPGTKAAFGNLVTALSNYVESSRGRNTRGRIEKRGGRGGRGGGNWGRKQAAGEKIGLPFGQQKGEPAEKSADKKDDDDASKEGDASKDKDQEMED